MKLHAAQTGVQVNYLKKGDDYQTTGEVVDFTSKKGSTIDDI